MEHVKHECDDDRCIVCVGGLYLCEVCSGAERSLPTDCPGRPLTYDEQEMIARGKKFDFLDGAWVIG